MTNEEIKKLKLKIKRLENKNRLLHKLVKFDFLTGLYNKREFKLILKKVINSQRLKNNKNKRAGRSNLSSSSLVMMDLDHFKSINDYYGHKIGDELLSKVAEFLKCNLRFSDYLFRFGGEEFSIIFIGLNSKQTYKVCERLRNLLNKQKFYCRPYNLKITASFGIYALKSNDLINQAISRADKALYQAKKTRNKTVIYSS